MIVSLDILLFVCVLRVRTSCLLWKDDDSCFIVKAVRVDGFTASCDSESSCVFVHFCMCPCMCVHAFVCVCVCMRAFIMFASGQGYFLCRQKPFSGELLRVFVCVCVCVGV